MPVADSMAGQVSVATCIPVVDATVRQVYMSTCIAVVDAAVRQVSVATCLLEVVPSQTGDRDCRVNWQGPLIFSLLVTLAGLSGSWG